MPLNLCSQGENSIMFTQEMSQNSSYYQMEDPFSIQTLDVFFLKKAKLNNSRQFSYEGESGGSRLNERQQSEPQNRGKWQTQANRKRNPFRGMPRGQQCGEMAPYISTLDEDHKRNNSMTKNFLLLLINTDIQRNDHFSKVSQDHTHENKQDLDNKRKEIQMRPNRRQSANTYWLILRKKV